MLKVKLMDCPQSEAISNQVALCSQEVRAILRGSSPEERNYVRSWLARDPVGAINFGKLCRSDLEHRLSPYIAFLSNDGVNERNSLAEWNVLQSLDLPSLDDITNRDEAAFCALLCNLHSEFVSESPGFRRAFVRSKPDGGGNYVRYAHPSQIRPQIGKIYNSWLGLLERHPAFASIYGMVALMNLHPFLDGNGRVARAFLHWSLGVCGNDCAFLPLHEVSALSRGGYLIRLREAQYFGRWEPLISLMHNVARRLYG